MTTLSIEQLNIYLRPAKLNYSSDSSIDATDKIVEEIIATKFLFLKKQIGDELFNQLSYSDKLFMAETAGSIDFGHAVDLYQIAREIKEYDNL